MHMDRRLLVKFELDAIRAHCKIDEPTKHGGIPVSLARPDPRPPKWTRRL